MFNIKTFLKNNIEILKEIILVSRKDYKKKVAENKRLSGLLLEREREISRLKNIIPELQSEIIKIVNESGIGSLAIYMNMYRGHGFTESLRKQAEKERIILIVANGRAFKNLFPKQTKLVEVHEIKRGALEGMDKVPIYIDNMVYIKSAEEIKHKINGWFVGVRIKIGI